jgi:N-acetylglucosaminyl-diphospho-decaprenol L-rhamnosyltransferase
MKNSEILSIIIVNYYTCDYTRLLIKTLSRQLKREHIQHEWIVVNNSPKENCFFLGRKALRVVRSLNRGFGAACNQGARVARGDIVWFLNPDMVYKEGSLREMLGFVKKQSSQIIVGSRLLDERGKTHKWIFGPLLRLHTWVWNKLSCGRKIISQVHRKQRTGWVSGASLLIPRKHFISLEGFDEEFFLYFEDMDLCLRAKKKGIVSWYVPDVVFVHRGGESFSSHKHPRKKQKSYYYTSLLLYAQKHMFFWERAFFRLLIGKKHLHGTRSKKSVNI